MPPANRETFHRTHPCIGNVYLVHHGHARIGPARDYDLPLLGLIDGAQPESTVIAKGGSENIIYFQNGSDGLFPCFDTQGNIYGVTHLGGNGIRRLRIQWVSRKDGQFDM
jgi:hypothetical protein